MYQANVMVRKEKEKSMDTKKKTYYRMIDGGGRQHKHQMEEI